MIKFLVITFGLSTVGLSFEPVVPNYEYSFPRDHFAHPEFRTEWWYYTGNVASSSGRRFGFELTFFRRAVEEEKTGEGSWAIRDLHLAHFALSDLEGGEFHRTERLNRSGPGLAGADLAQGRIWNGNWQVRSLAPEDPLGRQRLQATSEDFAIDLELSPRKPAVIHGLNGMSRKSAEAGHASHYISFTRLEVSGQVLLGGETHSVSGSAWMDHEFFTQGLAANQVGWDWMSIQLENNTELMLYRLRRRDGSADPFSSGTYVDAGGDAHHLSAQDFVMQPGDVWRSPETAGRYPVQWTVSVPSLQIVLECRTDLTSQEIVSRRHVGPNYWEGAVSFEGLVGDQEIRGVGYLEMTGYDKPVVLAPIETEYCLALTAQSGREREGTPLQSSEVADLHDARSDDGVEFRVAEFQMHATTDEGDFQH